MAVHITGTMGLPSGDIYPNCTMYFERSVGVVSQGGYAVVPEKTTVTSNGAALVDFYLLFGNYIGTIQTTLGVIKFQFSVLDVAAATFTSCIGNVSVPIPADSVSAAAASAAAAAASAAGSVAYTETDTAIGAVLIPAEVTIIMRFPASASVDQVAIVGELSWWKRTTLPTSQPYFTTSGGAVWTQVGYRESQTLATVYSALQGAYGSVRNFASRADVLTWISLNPAPAVGSVLSYDGISVRYIGSGTVIADMPGYVPSGGALDTFSVTRGDTSTRSILSDVTGTLHTIVSRSPSTSGRVMVINATTDASNTAPSGGTVELRLQVLGLARLTINSAGQVLLGNIVAYADDTAAAAGGIPVNGLYRTASALKIRVV